MTAEPIELQLHDCPFCGHAAQLTDSDKTGVFGDYLVAFGYTVLCSGGEGGCGATCGYWESEAEAALRWNTRTAVQQESEFHEKWRRARFEELKDVLELKDSDEGTTMNLARVRIRRLSAVLSVFETVANDAPAVLAALSGDMQPRVSEEQVAAILKAYAGLVAQHRPDRLKRESAPVTTEAP